MSVIICDAVRGDGPHAVMKEAPRERTKAANSEFEVVLVLDMGCTWPRAHPRMLLNTRDTEFAFLCLRPLRCRSMIATLQKLVVGALTVAILSIKHYEQRR